MIFNDEIRHQLPKDQSHPKPKLVQAGIPEPGGLLRHVRARARVARRQHVAQLRQDPSSQVRTGFRILRADHFLLRHRRGQVRLRFFVSLLGLTDAMVAH